MPTKKREDPVKELLQKLLIVQLALARVPGQQIRRVVGCSMNTVTSIVKHLKKREPVG